MTIRERIEKKEQELKELKAIQTSVKDTVKSFYSVISVAADEDFDACLAKVARGLGTNRWFNVKRAQTSPLMHRFIASIVADVMEEVTGDPGTSIDDLDIEEIKEVDSLVQSRLDEWLRKYELI